MIYTTRPKQRIARKAWDYFVKKQPPGKRGVELAYSPNIYGDGPGWIYQLDHTENDLNHWHGSEDIIFTILSSNLSAR
jgi:hypothetical protein